MIVDTPDGRYADKVGPRPKKALRLLKSGLLYSPMREIARHWPGRIYLILLLLSIVGFIAFLAMGGTDADANGDPVIVFGWMTMPLFAGVVFVLFWLVTYLIYFFAFWPYR